MKRIKYNGFTLVELIIVITILTILSTIAFISFQSYAKNTRDSNRLTTMNNIEKGLSLNQVNAGKTLLPDDNTQVLASGSLLGYEGIVGESVSRGIKMSSLPLDPLRLDNYIYYTNKDRNKIQVMGFMEGGEIGYMGIEKALADGTGSKIAKVTGARLGILLDSSNNRVTGSGLDILLTNSGTIYTTYFSNTDTITSSGKDLYSNVYNRRSDLLSNKSFASLDDSLVGYWDMETFSGGKLIDLSKYGNDLTSSGTPNIIDCKIGKCVNFLGNTFFNRSSLNGNSFTGNFSLSLWYNIPSIYKDKVNTLISKQYRNGSYTQGFMIRYRPSPYNLLNYSILSGSGLGFYSDDINIEKYFNNWNNIIMINDINLKKSKVYFNGKLLLESSNIYTPGLVNTDFIIGNSYTSSFGEAMKGKIDDIKVYNRTLSDSEIQQLYTSVK